MTKKATDDTKKQVNVSARITPADKALLEELVRRRAAKMAELAGVPMEGADSIASWLRSTIHSQARQAGLTIGSAPPAPSAPPPQATETPSKGKRKR